jgi:phage host-nuclease inhibitor protein Gam
MAKKPKSEETPILQLATKEAVVEAIAEMGRRQRERLRIETAMNDELAVRKQQFEQEAAPHAEAISVLSKQIQAYCETHREELTDAGKLRTVALASGEVQWRETPPKVTVRNPEQVLAMLDKLGLRRFIRTKEEVNKEALAAEPVAAKGIKGISLTQGERFSITPFETRLEEVV